MINWKKFASIEIFKSILLKKNAVLKIENSDGTTSDLSLAGLADELAAINGLTATAAEINAVADVSGRLINLADTALTLTAATHGERIVTLSHTGAASTVTLPAATGTGNIYRFIVAAVNTSNHVIKVANATDVMEGIAWMAADGGNTTVGWESGASDDTITLNGTTTGGAAIGDMVELIDYASGKWGVKAFLTGTGTEATPFSATVS